MADLRERIPIIGSAIRQQREIIESQNAYMAELAEEIKDWQAIAGQAEEKDVSWGDYKDNHKDCWEAYVENPLAKGYVDRLTDFVIKEGFQITSEDERTQEAIDSFLEKNEWDTIQHDICRELTIYGEIFARFFGNGLAETEIALTDPTDIKRIVTDPENVKRIERYLHEYKVVKYDNEGNEVGNDTRTNWIPAGEIIHLKVNTVSTAKRGISDLLCVLKWLNRHKTVATNLVRRSNIQMSIVGEKIIKGPGVSSTTTGGYTKSGDDATSTGTGNRKERMVTPGTWYVHTPQVEYKFTPIPNDVRGMIDLLKTLNKIICAGFGLSEHWLGDTSESNLATATSVEIPIMAKFERRQNELKAFFRKVIAKVLEMQGIDGAEFEVTAPEISSKDATAFATAIKTLAEGLVVAVDQQWISDESAAKTIGDYLDYFESFDDEQEKIDNLSRIKKEKEQIANFQQAIKEAEFTFQKQAMDELLDGYKGAYESAFAKAKKQVLSALKEKASG